MAPKMFLRVNGIGISKAWVRNRLEDGSPFGAPEVVIDEARLLAALRDEDDDEVHLVFATYQSASRIQVRDACT